TRRIEPATVLEALLKRCEHRLAIVHQARQVQVEHRIEGLVAAGIVRADLAVTQKANLPLDGVRRVAYAEAKAVIALARIAMLLAFGTAVPAQAGAVQIAKIELPPGVAGLALPVLNLHALGRGPDARLAVAAQAALLGHQCLPQGRLVGVVVVVG